MLLPLKSTKLCNFFRRASRLSCLFQKEHKTLPNFTQSGFRAFCPKKEHRTLPVLLRQVIPDSRSILDREAGGDARFRKNLRFLQFRVFFPSQGALEKSGLKICRIASFEAPDFTTFQASRSTIFLIRGSISRNYNSIGHRHCKNLVQVSIFLAREFAIKNS